ncbi:MAG: sigma 54-dependent Fis family transcriptional regulator [Deltaproteobacteria bacterium]|nr:MAG: sigma 54-dependent Fis family transcriptional regulator [Deltaproteobacteria bacterium]
MSSSQSSQLSNAPQATMTGTLDQMLEFLQRNRFSIEQSYVVVESGPHQGARVALQKALLYIGRAEWCDLALPEDRHISGIHCEIRVQPGGIRLIDRGSRNGCFLGAYQIFDALLKPGETFRLGKTKLSLQVLPGKADIDQRYTDAQGNLVGQTPKMLEIFALLERVGPRDIPVLLTGETGTGKTSLAQSLHQQSQREGALVVVNCGALSPSLIESELFGYEKGAFTGAIQQHQGYFEQAHGGTLFLDEIGELPLELQPKLLDVLERKSIRRLGGTQEKEVDFRLIAATHRNLKEHVQAGLFREDLFYRIAVMELAVPSLRDRLDDIPIVSAHLMSQIAPEQFVQVGASAQSLLKQHYWPGNLRELRNVLERSWLLCNQKTLEAHDLIMPHEFSSGPPTPPNQGSSSKPVESAGLAPEHAEPLSMTQIQPMKQQLAEAEKRLIREALDTLEWNVSKTAQLLEVSRSWLHAKIKSYDLQRPSTDE